MFIPKCWNRENHDSFGAARRPHTTGYRRRRQHNAAPCCRFQHTQGYQSIGSFHSDDMGVLMSMTEEEYSPPPLPFEPRAYNNNFSPDSRIAHSPNASDFMLDRKEWTFLNHGAFGASLKVGYDRAEQWRWYLEQQPLRYFDRALLPHLAYATRRLANFRTPLNSATSSDADLQQIRQGLTLIQNATSGLNSIMRGFAREYGSSARVVIWDTSYGTVKKLASHIFGSDRVMEIPFQQKYLPQFSSVATLSPSPGNPNQIFLEALTETFQTLQPWKEGHKVLLVLDHTTSNTAMTMPIMEIAQFAKQEYGDQVQVLVDGAHGLLAQKVDLQAFSPFIDYYVSNGHKWLSCPRGVGMLYCSQPDLRNTVLAEPAIISHGVDEPDLLSRFVWDGCRDYGAALALPAVLDFWEACGQANVMGQMKAALLGGIQILTDHWHGGCPRHSWLDERVVIVPVDLLSPMALVRLPDGLCGHAKEPKNSQDAKKIQDFLFDQRIEVPIKCINGALFVRVSAHVYNEPRDFDHLGKTLANISSMDCF